MISSRWLAVAVSCAVVTAGLALRPSVADPAKEITCPVMGHAFEVSSTTPYRMVNGKPIHLCCPGCVPAFDSDPEQYVAKVAGLTCPVMPGSPVKPSKSLRVLVNDGYFYLCCGGCPAAVTGAPEKYITYELRDPVSGRMFKVSTGQPRLEHQGVHYFFATSETKSAFEKDPAKYARKS
jgi:YHS domain-containing protein